MSGGSMDMSVVICAYTDERWQDLVTAVASVQRQTVPARQIILVVDHNPALLDHCRSAFPGVTIVENGEQRGISGARNTGVAEARASVVAFLDDDAEADADWLERLAEGYTDASVMGVGGSITPHWHTRAPDWFPTEFYWALGCSHSAMPQVSSPTRNMIGANMSVRRDVLEALGGFRHCFGKIGTRYSADETDLCIRGLQRWPQRIWLYEPSARVTHKQPASRATRRFFVTRCYDEGVSKAKLSSAVGAADGLANEYWYTFHVLPRAFLHGLGDTFLRGRPYGVTRALAIASGFAATAVGYALSAARERLAGRTDSRVVSAAGGCRAAPERTPGRSEA
ncbi:MAG: glycosyltransferase family 2 protein [Anaerolineae bacterium]|nr:glycosyltransferase family 2 protein [Anaerolineae bacterium]